MTMEPVAAETVTVVRVWRAHEFTGNVRTSLVRSRSLIHPCA